MVAVSTGYQTAVWHSYAPSNQRVWRGVQSLDSNGNPYGSSDEITFWSVPCRGARVVAGWKKRLSRKLGAQPGRRPRKNVDRPWFSLVFLEMSLK